MPPCFKKTPVYITSYDIIRNPIHSYSYPQLANSSPCTVWELHTISSLVFLQFHADGPRLGEFLTITIHAHICVWIYIYIYMYIYVDIQVYVYVYIHIYIYMRKCIYIYMYAYHTHTYYMWYIHILERLRKTSGKALHTSHKFGALFGRNTHALRMMKVDSPSFFLIFF